MKRKGEYLQIVQMAAVEMAKIVHPPASHRELSRHGDPQAPSSTDFNIRCVGIHLFWYRFSAERRNKKREDFLFFLLFAEGAESERREKRGNNMCVMWVPHFFVFICSSNLLAIVCVYSNFVFFFLSEGIGINKLVQHYKLDMHNILL